MLAKHVRYELLRVLASVRRQLSMGRRFRRHTRRRLQDLDGEGDDEGHPEGGNSLLGSQYGGGPEAFFQILHDWRAEGSLRGLELD